MGLGPGVASRFPPGPWAYGAKARAKGETPKTEVMAEVSVFVSV